MKKIKIILAGFFLVFFLIALNIKSSELKAFSESSSSSVKSYPIPIEIILSGNTQAAQEALKNGADVNAKYKDGFFKGGIALTVAIFKSNEKMVEFLLKNKADVNIRVYNENLTPLMLAAHFCGKKPEIVRMLLANGAGVGINAQNDYWRDTPLIFSVKDFYWEEQSQIVKLLLESGANVNIKNEFGRTFLNIINKVCIDNANEPSSVYYSLQNQEKNRKKVLEIYNEFIVQKELLKKNYFAAIEENDFVKILEILNKMPFLINEQNEMGETLLSESILFGRFEIIREIFENPIIKIKPNLLVGKVSEHLFNETNPVEYAIKLGRPGCDPAKKIYRDIAVYLRKQRDIQETLQAKANEK